MSRIGIAVLVLIFAGTVFMIGFLAYNFQMVTYPIPTHNKAEILTTTSIATSNVSPTKVSAKDMLPFDSSNKTVFLNLVALSTGNPFNFNGTSNGQLHIYIPAGWTVIATFTNQEGLTHNLLIVQNTTAIPGDDVGQDGTIKLYVGTTSSTYLDNGISGGASASGSVALSPGIYWFCCGIEGHAAAGMWGVIVVSSSVTTPYYTTS